jgi:hypothetical protein
MHTRTIALSSSVAGYTCRNNHWLIITSSSSMCSAPTVATCGSPAMPAHLLAFVLPGTAHCPRFLRAPPPTPTHLLLVYTLPVRMYVVYPLLYLLLHACTAFAARIHSARFMALLLLYVALVSRSSCGCGGRCAVGADRGLLPKSCSLQASSGVDNSDESLVAAQRRQRYGPGARGAGINSAQAFAGAGLCGCYTELEGCGW